MASGAEKAGQGLRQAISLILAGGKYLAYFRRDGPPALRIYKHPVGFPFDQELPIRPADKFIFAH